MTLILPKQSLQFIIRVPSQVFVTLLKIFKEKSVMGSKSKKKVEVNLQESLNSDNEWTDFIMKEVEKTIKLLQ